MSNEYDRTHFAEIDEVEQLKLVNGFQLDDNGSLVTEFIYDGQTVTFRDQNGDISEMSSLCYLDWVKQVCLFNMTDPYGNVSHPAGITPSNIVCIILDYLHDQWHAISEHNLPEPLSNENAPETMEELVQALNALSEANPGIGPYRLNDAGDIEHVLGQLEVDAFLYSERFQRAADTNNQEEISEDGIAISGGYGVNRNATLH
jgi:hypothetical protein